MKILVIALSGIGDALLFTPALEKLKNGFPSLKIDVLVMYKGVKDIYEKLPQINRVLFFDFLNSKKTEALFFTLSLRNKYDAAINVYPSNRKEYNLISWLINAKKRLAIEYLRADKKNWGWLNNLRIKEDDSLHNVEENIKLVELLLAEKKNDIPHLQFVLGSDDLKYAEEFTNGNSIDENDLVIGFHAGCSTLKNQDKRRWETWKFAQLANILIKKYNAKILLFGGIEEEKLKNEIKNNVDSKNCFSVQINKLTHAAAVMKKCSLFITNDSSLMHIAAALKLNTVAIIGPTNKNYIYPWQTNYEIASLNLECSPCFYYSPKPLTCTRTDVKFKCIKDLPVELVLEKAEAQIRKLRPD